MRNSIRVKVILMCALVFGASFSTIASEPAERQLLWGDTHVHTSNSFDAFLNGNRTADPEYAYQFAQGKPMVHPLHRARVQIDSPLDFIVIADHAELYGFVREAYNNGLQVESDSPWEKAKEWFYDRQLKKFVDKGFEAFVKLLPVSEDASQAALSYEIREFPFPNVEGLSTKVWNQATTLADEYNQPGKFTTLIGWEWSSVPGGANLHRVVFTDGDSKGAQKFLPYSSVDSPFPEDLHQWLDKISDETQMEFIAIPHNSNISKGYMFPNKTLRGESFTEKTLGWRNKWEPVIEMTQYKGDSETHPVLSPNDEFADFEQYGFYIQQKAEPYKPQKGDYARSALKRGLEIERETGINPYNFGFIGSTDSHSSLVSVEETSFAGKFVLDSIPENKSFRGDSNAVSSGWNMSASGLAAVWADDNNRSSIMQAFKRKEVYATTGPRIVLQMFAGWSFTEADLNHDNFRANAYKKGIPMGSDLITNGESEQSLTIMVKAAKDPNKANLDRIQIVKGWIDATGQTHEKVYDVEWSGQEDGSRGKDSSGRPEAIKHNIDLTTGFAKDTSLEQGVAELLALWVDPEFDAAQNAFYYSRVLEIPTARHSLYDWLALGKEGAPRGGSVLQERAYSSAIWYKAK